MLPGTILISWKSQLAIMILVLKGHYHKIVTSFKENSSEFKGTTQSSPKEGTM